MSDVLKNKSKKENSMLRYSVQVAYPCFLTAVSSCLLRVSVFLLDGISKRKLHSIHGKFLFYFCFSYLGELTPINLYSYVVFIFESVYLFTRGCQNQSIYCFITTRSIIELTTAGNHMFLCNVL